MVKKYLIKSIKLYQKMPISTHRKCRFIPTCSNYAISTINDFGVIKGCFLTLRRILRCNPWNKNIGIDLPPKKENHENTKN